MRPLWANGRRVRDSPKTGGLGRGTAKRPAMMMGAHWAAGPLSDCYERDGV